MKTKIYYTSTSYIKSVTNNKNNNLNKHVTSIIYKPYILCKKKLLKVMTKV